MKTDPYASEEETRALLCTDARTETERKLDAMISEAWGDEQGAESEVVLRAMLLGLLVDVERKDALLRRMVDAWDEPEQSLTACYGVVQAIKQELSQ